MHSTSIFIYINFFIYSMLALHDMYVYIYLLASRRGTLFNKIISSWVSQSCVTNSYIHLRNFIFVFHLTSGNFIELVWPNVLGGLPLGLAPFECSIHCVISGSFELDIPLIPNPPPLLFEILGVVLPP